MAAVVLGVLTAVTGFLGYNQFLQKKLLETHLANRNQKAFFEMTDHVRNMQVLMSKGMVANSPRQNILLFSDLWQQANAAQNNLASLPVNQATIGRTSRFIRQAGDFAYTLAKKNARGIPVKSGDWDTLARLHTEAGVLNTELQRILTHASDGKLTWGEIGQATPAKLNKANQQLSSADGMNRIDKRMQEYPTLIYDGPFSDHIKRRQPMGLSGKNISSGDAGLIALDFAHAASGKKYIIRGTSQVNGTIPAFRVHLRPAGGQGAEVVTDISRKGGHGIWMLNPRSVNRSTITSKDGAKKAGQFLVGRGKADLEGTYTLEQRDMSVTSFAYKQEGVLVYPDLIKVKVALDNGEIIGYEAMGYLMSHTTRKLPKPKITEAEARRAVSSRLKINSTRLALIPLETFKEVLCYEIKGTLNKDPFIVYINALNGEEERIMKIIETNGGPSAM